MKRALSFFLCLGAVAGFAQPAAQTTFLNPATVAVPRGYSHAAVVDLGSCKMVFVAGQVALDSAGNLVGEGDVEKQTVQVFRNIQNILKASGGDMNHVVKINYYMLDAGQVQKVRDIRDKFINTAQPPASTLVQVGALFRKEFLIEVEATAVIPKQGPLQRRVGPLRYKILRNPVIRLISPHEA